MAMTRCVGVLAISLLVQSAFAAGAQAGVKAGAKSDTQALGRTAGDPFAGPAPVLMSFLRQLQSQATVGVHFAHSVSQWCRLAREQKQHVLEMWQRKLDEVAVDRRRVAVEANQLSGAQHLANETQGQKEQQLQDAITLANYASAEFTKEQQELQKTIDAIHHATQLVHAQMASGNSRLHGANMNNVDTKLPSSLAQISTEMMTDDEKSTIAEFVRGQQTSAGASIRPKDLLDLLEEMSSRMQTDSDQAIQEHNTMMQKLWAFTDHQNASIMAAHSHVVEISQQLAHRTRELASLDAKVVDFTALVKAGKNSWAATNDACTEEANWQGQIAASFASESEVIRTMLKQVSLGSYSGSMSEAAPTFLQLHDDNLIRTVQDVFDDLKSMADQFPDEAAWYNRETQNLEGIHHQSDFADDQPKAAGDQSQAAGNTTGHNSKQQVKPNNAFESIQNFVDSSADVGDSKAPEEPSHADSSIINKIKSSYEDLLNRVGTSEKAISDRQNLCTSIVRDAVADKNSLALASERVDMRLNVVRASITENEQMSSRNEKQSKVIATQLKQLMALSKLEEQQQRSAGDKIESYSSQLLSFASELSQQTTPDEVKTANMMRDVVLKVKHYQALDRTRHGHFEMRRKAIEAADQAVEASLTAAVKHSQRRLIRLRTEAQLLESLSAAKRLDKEMSEQDEHISKSLCSSGQLNKFHAKATQLLQEEKMLRNSEISRLALN